MKEYSHWLWYAAGLIGLGGLWLGSEFFSDAWFPMFCFAMAQVTRMQNQVKPKFFERAFDQGWVSKLAMGSVIAVVCGITLWVLYLKHIEFPRNDARDIQEFKDRWHAAKLEVRP